MRIIKKKNLLIIGIIFNLFSVFCSLCMPSSINKMNIDLFNFLFEFFTINWCVWSSFITCIYNIMIINEIKSKKGEFDLIVATSNLVVMLVFTANIFTKTEIIENKPYFWWIYSIIWHYIAPIIFLSYFFIFAKVKNNYWTKKNLFYVAIPMPILFTIANLLRRNLVDGIYFDKPYNFKKFLISPFKLIEEGKLVYFASFCVSSLLMFWIISFILLKVKRKYF